MSEILEPTTITQVKPVKIMPTIELDSTDLPEIKDYDVGDTYSAVIQCKMISKHAPRDDNSPDLYPQTPKGVIRGRFQILSIKPVDKDSTSDSASGKIKAIKKRAY